MLHVGRRLEHPVRALPPRVPAARAGAGAGAPCNGTQGIMSSASSHAAYEGTCSVASGVWPHEDVIEQEHVLLGARRPRRGGSRRSPGPCAGAPPPAEPGLGLAAERSAPPLPRQRRRVERLPRHQRPRARIGREQAVEQRRAGALEAGDDDGPYDRRRADLRVRAVEGLDAQPVLEQGDDPAAHDGPPRSGGAAPRARWSRSAPRGPRGRRDPRSRRGRSRRARGRGGDRPPAARPRRRRCRAGGARGGAGGRSRWRWRAGDGAWVYHSAGGDLGELHHPRAGHGVSLGAHPAEAHGALGVAGRRDQLGRPGSRCATTMRTDPSGKSAAECLLMWILKPAVVEQARSSSRRAGSSSSRSAASPRSRAPRPARAPVAVVVGDLRIAARAGGDLGVEARELSSCASGNRAPTWRRGARRRPPGCSASRRGTGRPAAGVSGRARSARRRARCGPPRAAPSRGRGRSGAR